MRAPRKPPAPPTLPEIGAAAAILLVGGTDEARDNARRLLRRAAAAPKPRRRAPDDPHRSQPSRLRGAPKVTVTLSRETLARINKHVAAGGRSRWVEGLIVAALDQLDATRCLSEKSGLPP